jgi:hypothetical protein
MNKKPAILSDRLLTHRPRKGEARPQTEIQAEIASPKTVSNIEDINKISDTTPMSVRRRRRRTEKTQQLNLRVSEETLKRFTQLADSKKVMFGDLLSILLDKYKDDS